ncbi:unnamed protein product [Arabis nemorensis]|uniref:Uncharacterized protein n=1 Tax=Arabis nemorensis TaxID=586526 RepID=A0A565ATT0_9BRAS|nr:unnamed protein product [Arabis nemorensis]
MSFGPGPQNLESSKTLKLIAVTDVVRVKSKGCVPVGLMQLRNRRVIHKRNGPFPHLLLDVPKRRRSRLPYEIEWTKSFLFIKVGHDPGYPAAWFYGGRLTGFKRQRFKEGLIGAWKVISIPEKDRSVSWLLNPSILKKSTIQGGTMAGSGETISNTLEKFRRARGASIPAPLNPASKDKQTVPNSSMKHTITHCDGAPRVFRILKKQCSGGVSTTSDLSLVIDDLNESHFSRDLESFRELGFTAVLDDVQSSHFKAMSACYCEKMRFPEAETEMKRLSEDNIKIKEFESQKTLLNSTIAAKNQEVSSWMGKVDVLKGDVASLEANNEESKRIVTCLEQQLELATSGATIINTWKMTQEFQDGKAPNWKVEEPKQLIERY